MTKPDQANFLLIDGVRRPQVLIALHQRNEPLEILPLYSGTRWQALHNSGPILVNPGAQSSLISDWLSEPLEQPDFSLLYSVESLQTIANHLRHFICPPDALGGNGLLRFADPLVAHYWLASYSADALSVRLGPIEKWCVQRPIHSWEKPHETPWQTFSRVLPYAPWDARYAHLDHGQLAALNEAHRWKFEEDAYQWLIERNRQHFAVMDSQRTSDWLKHTIESGLNWGLVGERALIIWAETCIDLGVDFATRSDSPYQVWLSLDSERARLAPELRIKAFDQYRHSHRDLAHG